MNNFYKLFHNKKPILGMLHLKGNDNKEIFEIAKKELEIYENNNVDAVVVENYFGKEEHVEMMLHYLNENPKNIIYGVNLLDNDDLGFKLAKKYNAKFIQLDSVAGHLPIEEDKEFNDFIEKNRKDNQDLVVLGGVRFKYQPYKSGRTLEEDLQIGMTRCDAIVVTQDSTGQETSMEKVDEFRKIIGDFPLVVGAGMTKENIHKQLTICDGAVVGSYFKDSYKDTGDVAQDHVKNFMKEVKKLR